ncbi:hypothetical protein CW745_05025 [Psychromonas sp. psych-6C06]|uniref:5-oxoprolinase subunit C family protein n=1 Tax=Psychromonas sp. psych-6C06 TaxID=2058089 RepID=UPI000C32D81B|nr:biotin-dependent carboxyltransferase family protein [Psychromonas sp. psych-6C06]PKF62787.1 hypothetical protein CW745_05025 [Psychromonas sp. psych-6C06]
MSDQAGLIVIKAGLFTLIQDQGRFNHAQQGLSQGGVCDELAAGWANYLLGNKPDCAVLEICFGQAEFEATQTIALALTGAPMNAQIKLHSGKLISQINNCSFVLEKGQRLQLSFASSGVRAYLAAQGGIDAPSVLGSLSCVKRNAIGGLQEDGQALKDNDFLAIKNTHVSQPNAPFIARKMPTKFIPDYQQPVCLSVLESYQCDAFSVHQKQRFYHSEYIIDKQSDRMGMRLQGEAIKGRLTGIVSEGIALGSIQIPSGGQPIVLLQDRQTLGGYPKIGCVARCDLSLLAQQAPGTALSFKRGNLQVEQMRYLQRLRFFHA